MITIETFCKNIYLFLLLTIGVIAGCHGKAVEMNKNNQEPVSTSEMKPAEEDHTILKINNVAKKSKAEVDAYLGETMSHESVSPSNAPCPCEKYGYKAGNIEIVFMNNKADWITMYNINAGEFTPEAILKSFGLTYVAPVIQDKQVIKWNDFDGFDQLSAFSDGKGGISYIYLKAITH